jgi:hypothetical protein
MYVGRALWSRQWVLVLLESDDEAGRPDEKQCHRRETP